MHNFRSGVDTNLVDAGMTLDQATAVTGHTKKVAEEAFLRLQLDSKRKAMDTLAEAYGIGDLEDAPAKKIRRPRKPRRDFKVRLTKKEVLALEDLAARSQLQKRENSGTRSGTSPRRKRRKPPDAGQLGEKSAVSTFVDSRITMSTQKPKTCPLSRRETIDRYFMEHRAKLIDIAAFLDRVDRTEPEAQDDFRLAALREAAKLLVDAKPDRAKRILELFSDPTMEPLESAAGMKGAAGTWPGRAGGGGKEKT